MHEETHFADQDSLSSPFSWIIKARYKNQLLMLKLCRYKNSANDGDRRISNFLVGVAFSLWRASFLIDLERNDKQIDDNSIWVLERLIADNAIGYDQDLKARHWMSGYYINDARFRLIEIQSRLKLKNDEFETVSIPEFNNTERQNLFDYWDFLHNISETIFTFLSQIQAK